MPTTYMSEVLHYLGGFFRFYSDFFADGCDEIASAQKVTGKIVSVQHEDICKSEKLNRDLIASCKFEVATTGEFCNGSNKLLLKDVFGKRLICLGAGKEEEAKLVAAVLQGDRILNFPNIDSSTGVVSTTEVFNSLDKLFGSSSTNHLESTDSSFKAEHDSFVENHFSYNKPSTIWNTLLTKSTKNLDSPLQQNGMVPVTSNLNVYGNSTNANSLTLHDGTMIHNKSNRNNGSNMHSSSIIDERIDQLIAQRRAEVRSINAKDIGSKKESIQIIDCKTHFLNTSSHFSEKTDVTDVIAKSLWFNFRSRSKIVGVESLNNNFEGENKFAEELAKNLIGEKNMQNIPHEITGFSSPPIVLSWIRSRRSGHTKNQQNLHNSSMMSNTSGNLGANNTSVDSNCIAKCVWTRKKIESDRNSSTSKSTSSSHSMVLYSYHTIIEIFPACLYSQVNELIL